MRIRQARSIRGILGLDFSQQEEGTNEVRLGIELTNPDGTADAHTLRLVREDSQWFPVMHVWLQGPKSVQAAMDIPPKFRPHN